MSAMHLGPRASDFIWASGIEDSFVPQTRKGHRALDEYQLMGHYEHWRVDLALGRDLGIGALRWGVPWYRVEPIPGEFDWRWTDQVIPYIVEELGITPIIDLMHYGCPYWMRGEFINEGYPQAVAAYAAAFAERYKHLVQWYTPLNEPIINSMMCGRNGAWPPYLRGEKGYVRIIVQLAKGIVETVAALKAVDPEAGMVHVEAASVYRAAEPGLEWLAEESRLKGFVVFDLITGRVTPEHPLYGWLTSNGVRPSELAAIASRPAAIDIMGLNFYPQWSTHDVYVNDKGFSASRCVEKQGLGFGDMLQGFYHRYGVPIMITETSAKDSDAFRLEWLHRSLATIKQLRADGVPVLGYTWFPMCTMIDWDYRCGRGPLEKYLLELGVYGLNRAGGECRWNALPLLEEFRACINNPEDSVGDLAVG